MCDQNEELKETPQQAFEREMREYEGKNIQHYAVNLAAWFNTKLEKDKSIITISSAAVGLLVTIITAKGVQSLCQVTFYLFSFIGFLTAIITSIQTLDQNAEQVRRDITNEGNINTQLRRNDIIVSMAFYAGIIFTTLVGISYGVNQYIKETGEKAVVDNKINQPSKVETIKEGFTRSDELKPVPPKPPITETGKKEK